jgi:NAD(P)-dependent dehydrogenase (short-subunit alcohol dehydrogenase family)
VQTVVGDFTDRAAVERIAELHERPSSYGDSKLFVTTLAAAVARPHPGVLSNTVDPGWVPTRMADRAPRTMSNSGIAPRRGSRPSDDPTPAIGPVCITPAAID